MRIPRIKQLVAVGEYEFKQAFYSRKALIAFAVISSFFFILLYWLYRLETAVLARESVAEARIAEKFKEIIIENFYSSFPFLAECPFYVTILQFYFMVCIPVLTFILIADIATHELRDKTFRYFVFRIDLKTVMLGKFFAYALQFSILSLLMWGMAIVVFENVLSVESSSTDLLLAFRYAFHFWFIDHVIWFCTIAISLYVSIVFKNPYIAAAFIDILLIYLMASQYTRDFMYNLFMGFIYPISWELGFSLGVYALVTSFFLGLCLITIHRKELT